MIVFKQILVPLGECWTCRLSRVSLLTRSSPARPLFFHQQIRTAAGSAKTVNKYKKKKEETKAKSRKKNNPNFKEYNLKDAEQFALCDAMRYLRAFEVGYPQTSSKYELHVKLRTVKNGPVVRNRLRLPYAVNTDIRICVICPPDSRHAKTAIAAGADPTLVGEEEIFNQVKEGQINFERCICQEESLQKLQKAGIARILGPRGLMPSAKLNTVVKDVGPAVRDLVGGSEYRERLGVVRMAVGQLAFTPEQMQKNIRAFMESVKRDCAQLADRVFKEVYEVVLSSTNGPGFSLNGDFKSVESVPTAALSV